MSDNPKNDDNVDWGSNPGSDFSYSGSVVTMHPKGATDFGIGKNVSGFNDSIGGCNMDFKATAKRGYAYKADDARDIEYKCLLKATGIEKAHDGISISVCTGHHDSSSNVCCQGFAYMGSIGTTSNPSTFRFRKETYHVQYTDAPETNPAITHPKCNFKIDGLGRFVGFGFCRYNKPVSGGTSPQDDNVILEMWFNPNPDDDPSDWTMIKRIEDKPGKGWTGAKGKCNGDNDQIGPWSGAQSRIKCNSSGGSIQFKSVTLREIDPFGTFEEPPPPVQCPAGQHPDANGNCVLDSSGGGTGGGGTGGGSGGPPSYVYEYKFGTQGSGNGQFLNPHDVSFDAAGNCFVCDRNRNDVQKFTHTGTYISKFGSSGSGNGQFNVPYAIQHTNDYSAIYIMDRDNNRIQKLDASGNYVSKITTANGKNLNAPEDICFDVAGNFYVCDTGNNRIVEFAADHSFIREWGSKGSGNGQFDHPHSMDMGLDGNVYINSGNQAYIQVFTPTGTFIRKFSKAGTHDGELLTFLEHLDIDYKGRLHIINNNARPIVSVFDCATGNFLTKYGSPEHEGSANGQFREPEHVTVDSTGKPFVVDSSNFRIQVFSVVEPPPDPDPGGGGGSGGPPAEPTKVKGFFTLKRDINIYRTDACEGTGGGGGAGGSSTPFYDVSTALATGDSHLGIGTFVSGPRTRTGQIVNNSSSLFKGKNCDEADFYLSKTGTPTGTLTCKIRKGSDDTTAVTLGTVDVSTLGTSMPSSPTTFINANTYILQTGDKIMVEYNGGDATNYVQVWRVLDDDNGGVNIFDGVNTCQVGYEGEPRAYVVRTNRDVCGKFWQT